MTIEQIVTRLEHVFGLVIKAKLQCRYDTKDHEEYYVSLYTPTNVKVAEIFYAGPKASLEAKGVWGITMNLLSERCVSC